MPAVRAQSQTHRPAEGRRLDPEVLGYQPVMKPEVAEQASAPVAASALAAAEELVEVLASRGLRVVAAESFTGGLASYLLVGVPDSADVVAGSVVTYSTDEKRRVLDVPDCPVVSSECAARMAAGAVRLYEVACAVSFTGVAGPATQEGQPVGTTFIGVRFGERAGVLQRRYEGSADDIRLRAIADGFAALRDLVQGGPPSASAVDR